jgi:acetyl esterase/lipase
MRPALLVLAVVALAAEPAVHLEMPYRTVAGVQLTLDIALPEASTGRVPLIVCLHGGGWSMGSKSSFRRYLPEFARLGYAAASIQYRLAPAHKFPAQIEDIHAAISFLRANAGRWNLDPARVSLLGASAGAHLALLAGFDNRSRVNAVIDISGPADLRDWRMSPNAERTLQSTTGKATQTLLDELLGDVEPAAASPVAQLKRGAPPVLVFHWREDQAVAAAQAERLLAALQGAGVAHEAVWFEGRGHALNGPGVDQIVPRTVAFLDRLPR